MTDQKQLAGKVRVYRDDKGYGFFARDDGGDDVFVHATAFSAAGLAEPIQGERYAFSLKTEHRSGKMQATNLRKLRRVDGLEPSDAERANTRSQEIDLAWTRHASENA
jgi:cold shock CspA family protein